MKGFQGWILAPLETKEAFLKRKKTWDEVAESKQKGLELPLYHLKEIEASVFYSNKSLLPWQGAVLWECFTESGEKYPAIQMRENLSQRFIGKCSEEEVLSHELVHTVRFAFKEPIFEEMFAYQTSKSRMRRFWGPLFIWPLESVFFATLSAAAPFISLFLGALWGTSLLVGVFSFFFLRLLFLHIVFSLCRSKLNKIGVLSKDCLAVMIRLSDFEILKSAFESKKKTVLYFKQQAENDERLQAIVLSYFRENKDF